MKKESEISVKKHNLARRTGNIRFSEWSGLWKQTDSDEDVSADEYEQVTRKLDRYCRRIYRQNPQYIEDFYIRGDNAGDRTQVLEINTPETLNLKFVKEIQSWLSTSGLHDWRILIPTYITKKETVIIYSSAIKISKSYERPLKKGIESIALRMARQRWRRQMLDRRTLRVLRGNRHARGGRDRVSEVKQRK